MTPGLFVRADAGPTIGVGHFMRMLALAEEWEGRGGRVTFGGAIPPALQTKTSSQCIERPADADDAQWTIAQARALGASWVAADGYAFGAEFQRELVASGLKLLVVDDNGENREYAANLILNVNPHARVSMYAQRATASRLLLGIPFLLLRAAILRARLPSTAKRESLLISFGGADPADATSLALRAIESQPSLVTQPVVVLVGAANARIAAYRAAHERKGVRILIDPQNVADEMASAALSLCTPSTTFWELSYLGVPCLGLVVADNQSPIAAEVHARGVMKVLGDARAMQSPDALGRTLVELMSAPDGLQRMADAARGLSDGRGASRVVDAMLGNAR